MNLSPIRKLVQKTKQHDPKELGRDSIMYIDISSIDRQTKRISEPQIIPADEAPGRARKQVYADDVLVSTVRPNLNAVALVPTEFHDEIASTGFCVLRTKKDALDPRYLFYFTQTSAFISRLTRLSIGAGYPAVSDGTILDTEIPLPPLPEQQRIAEVLSKADRLRRLRRTARELSDTYLQSVFLEMFGDPVSNPMGWEIGTLGEMLQIPPHIGTITPAQESGKQLCVRVGEIGEWYINLRACKYASLDGRDLERFSLLPGDIVLARAIGSEAHLGKLSIMGHSKIPVVFDSHIMRLRLDESVLSPQFFMCWMRTSGGRARFMKQARRTAVQFNVNAKQMAAVEIPLPLLPLQQQFAHIVHKFERLHAQQRQAECQAEHLFQTLLHRAFQGEL